MASGGRVARAAAWRGTSSLTPGAGDDPAATRTQSSSRCYAGRAATGAHGQVPHHRQSVHHLPQLTSAEPPSEKKVSSPVNGTKRLANSFAPSPTGWRVSTSSLLTKWAAISD